MNLWAVTRETVDWCMPTTYPTSVSVIASMAPSPSFRNAAWRWTMYLATLSTVSERFCGALTRWHTSRRWHRMSAPRVQLDGTPRYYAVQRAAREITDGCVVPSVPR